MSIDALLAEIENQSQLYIDQMTPKQIAYIDGINRGLMSAIDIINKHMTGIVPVPVAKLEELLNGQDDGEWYHGFDLHSEITAMITAYKGE